MRDENIIQKKVLTRFGLDSNFNDLKRTKTFLFDGITQIEINLEA